MNNHWSKGLSVALAAAFILGAPPASADGGLTLDEALARVMEKNLQLMASHSARLASGAREDQAGRRPNPELIFDWENLAGGGELSFFRSSELTLMLSQTFELGGKRGRRRDQAAGVSSLVDWDRQTQRQDLALKTKEAFLAVWAAQSRLDLAVEQRELFRKLLEDLQRSVSAGAASAVDLNRTRGKFATAKLVCRSRQQQLDSACRRLAALWNSTEPGFSRVSGDFDSLEPSPVSDDPAELLADNPELGQWRARVALQRANRELSRAEGAIDLNLGLGVKHFAEFGDQAMVLGVGLPLPVFDRNKDEVRAADYELEQVRLEAEAVAVSLLTEIAVAVQEDHSARDAVRTLREEIIPEATEAFESTVTGHERGIFTITDVFDTRHFLYDLREAHIDAMVRHFTATARLRRLIGTPGSQAALTEGRNTP